MKGAPWEYKPLKEASGAFAPKKDRIVGWPVIGKVWLFARVGEINGAHY